jgi:hypothetical protein
MANDNNTQTPVTCPLAGTSTTTLLCWVFLVNAAFLICGLSWQLQIWLDIVGLIVCFFHPLEKKEGLESSLNGSRPRKPCFRCINQTLTLKVDSRVPTSTESASGPTRRSGTFRESSSGQSNQRHRRPFAAPEIPTYGFPIQDQPGSTEDVSSTAPTRGSTLTDSTRPTSFTSSTRRRSPRLPTRSGSMGQRVDFARQDTSPINVREAETTFEHEDATPLRPESSQPQNTPTASGIISTVRASLLGLAFWGWNKVQPFLDLDFDGVQESISAQDAPGADQANDEINHRRKLPYYFVSC